MARSRRTPWRKRNERGDERKKKGKRKKMTGDPHVSKQREER